VVAVCLGLLLTLAGPAAAALDAAALAKLASEDANGRMEAIDAIAAGGDEAAMRVLTALQDGLLRVTPKGQVFIKQRGSLLDALTGTAVETEPEDLAKISINNRMRSQVEGVMAGLRIFSTDPKQRLEAARAIEPDEKMLATLDKALARESVAEIRDVLEVARAASQLRSGDTGARLAAIARLAGSRDPKIKTLLLALLEPDARVREAAADAVRAIDRRLMVYDFAQRLFAGVSLGSILMLAALGLAITYGLLGVINMAHGEMLMIGAYAAYATQSLFRARFPGALDWYLVCAVPVAFLSAAAVGVVLERTVFDGSTAGPWRRCWPPGVSAWC
jgi:urea transport system permease protein